MPLAPEEMKFRRQPLPVVITVTGGEAVDQNDMMIRIMRFLNNQPGYADYGNNAIHWYPMAVND